MICPKCHREADRQALSCSNCGSALVPMKICLHCRSSNLPESRFCDQCGMPLKNDSAQTIKRLKSERKHVTVLFSDINRYQEIANRVDPEDIQDVTRRLFEEMVKIITRYDGHVDRILWDGVLAVFGMPHAHEDDAIRAIRAAMEIHQVVARVESRFTERIGVALAMRSGVATGLVVTGSTEERTGRHGITGETVNLAARIRDMALPGEVLVESGVFSAAAGFFHFALREPVPVKGRTHPVPVYGVQSLIPRPDKVRRIHGLKARLVGRAWELKTMEDAALRLQRKEGTVITVCGDAGTGKSRLIAEFKRSSDAEAICWLDGYAYAYNGGVPYYPFIDMLSRLFDIDDADGQAVIEAKLSAGIGPLLDDLEAVVPFLAGLYAVSPSEALQAGPEVYKAQLQNAFIALFSALARRGPTIVCIEDLHWADPSSLSLMRFLLRESGLPILFVISHRPILDFLGDHHGGQLSYEHKSLLLKDLDVPSSREMVRSLINTRTIPAALERYIFSRVGGNPFYLEEVVNALLDNCCLKRVEGQWHFDETVDISEFSSTINGIVHGRLDRLGNEAKSVLQEAAVIGRVFRIDLLEQITAFPQACSDCIDAIERMNLIRRIPEHQAPTYGFKHTIVQEVVYKSLLKKDRRIIHGRIARTLESRFQGRLDSVPELLALHYANSDHSQKAANYLIRSGEKSLKKYAVEESHRYYEKAYRLLSRIKSPSAEDQAMLIDLILKWYFTFNKKGLFREMLDLLRIHEPDVRAFGDASRIGMYEVCLGWALQRRELLFESYDYLTRALATGRTIGDDSLIAYSSACLCWTCADLGRLEEALTFGREAAEIAGRIETDNELIRFNLTGMGLAYVHGGNLSACWNTAEQLLDFGDAAGDVRTFSEGYLLMGNVRMAAGDFVAAEFYLNKAIEVAVDPIYSLNARFCLSYAYFFQGKVAFAAQTLETVIDATRETGYEYVGTSAKAFYGIVSATMGDMETGIALVREQLRKQRKRGKRNHDMIFTSMLGRFYLSLVLEKVPLGFGCAVKNARFLLRSLPVASRLAERYLREAIDIGTRIDARIRLAQAHLDLGRLYIYKKRYGDARSHIVQSITLFDGCCAPLLLAEAQTALDTLPH